MPLEYEELVAFINNSPTAFHAATNIRQQLAQSGFSELSEKNSWTLVPGGRYFVTRNSSAIIAFVCGQQSPWESGFRILGAHTDSPALRVKPQAELVREAYVSVRVELYGGTIVSTWLDRELSLAGRVLIRTKQGLQSSLVNIKRPIAIIPNVAIHMNREVNKGFEYNPHSHLPAILVAAPGNAKSGAFMELIASECGVSVSDVVDTDLFFYDATPARTAGINSDFIVAPRLDNLAMCHSILKALENAPNSNHTSAGFFFDNEETGSHTFQGADSSFARHVLERIVLAQKGSREEFLRAAARSFLISADMAHALHPNFADKHDDKYAPLLNAGPVIKQNGNNRYATTAETSAIFESLCQQCEVKVQKVINRADVGCGSTIGPISSSDLSIPTVDVGNPMWAMHSVRETAGTSDHGNIIKVFRCFLTDAFKI